MESETEQQKNDLYLLSARGSSTFAKRSAGMELVAELNRQRGVDHLFVEETLAELVNIYCDRNDIPITVATSYEWALREIKSLSGREQNFVYLTDKENGELKSMADKAKSQRLQVETRTRTKY